MFGLGSTSLGLILVIIGLLFLVVIPLILRLIPRLRESNRTVSLPSPIQTDIPPNQSAIIMVQSGGRVIYINDLARQWFNLLENETPNLERMARNARPTEALLNLCAAPGQTRFNLQQNLVEGTSVVIPYEDQHAVLVSLERPQLTGLDDDTSSLPYQAINIFTDISQKMSASLDLRTTITTILEGIDQLIPSDFSEVTLWDAENGHFIPYRYLIREDGIRQIQTTTERYEVDKGYTAYVAKMGKSIIIDDVPGFTETRPVVSRQLFPIRSFLGIPLSVGTSLLGTIELASQSPSAFNQSDQEILELLSGHIANALRNAIIHSNQQQRSSEMAGLADLAQVGTRLYETEDLYGRLLETISPMLNVEILGFLIYDETTHILEGKVPFQGLPEQVAALYQTHIPENSKGEHIWLEQDVIITDDTSDDSPLGALGLSPLAQAAAIRETALVPLTTSGRALGYLQAANKVDGTSINDDDLRLMRIISGQVAPILENARLIDQSRQRAQRAEALRRIASLAGSGATIDEILKFSILELARYLQANTALVLLLDDNVGKLELHEDSMIGLQPDDATSLIRYLTNEANVRDTVTGTTLPLVSSNLDEDLGLTSTYEALRQYLPGISSAMMIPLIIRDRGIGEIIIGSHEVDFFDVNDSQSITSAISQLASAVERSSLLTQTDESLQRRVDQLTTLNRISRDLNTSQNIKQLLQQVHDEVLRNTRADSCSILLFENEPEKAIPDKIALQIGPIEHVTLSELEEKSLREGEPIIISNFSFSAFQPDYPGIRSEMVIPIAYQSDTVGLIHLHSKDIDHFDALTSEITQTLAVQSAIAIRNFQRYQEQVERSVNLARRMEGMGKLVEINQAIDMEMPLEMALEKIAKGVQESSIFDIVMIYLYDPSHKVIRPAAYTGLPDDHIQQLREAVYPWEHVSQLIRPKFSRGGAYFIPYTERPDIPPLVPEYALLSLTVPEDSENSWQPGDRLIFPLTDSQDKPLGVVSVDAPRSGYRPDDITIETIEMFTKEAALVIKSGQSVIDLKKQLERIQTEISRTEHVSQVSQGHLSTLLQKDLEQTLAIQTLYDRARNIRVGLDIAENINRQPDRESVLRSLASQMLTEMELDIALVAETSMGGPRLLSQFGTIPPGTNPQALLGQRNPLYHSIQTGETVFVPNMEENPEWQGAPLLKSMNTKGFIALPITSNGKVDVAVLAISNTPLPDFTKEDQHIYDLISNQVSITLQNLTLLTETRRRLREVNLLLDFSRQLGSLDPHQILNTLITSIRKVMPNVHGMLISLWNDQEAALVTELAKGYTDNDLIKQLKFQIGQSVVSLAYENEETINIEELDFASHYNLSPDDLLLYREATGGRLPVSSLLVPIRTSEVTLGIVTLDNFNTPGAFLDTDIAVVESLTQQTALTLENARLFDESRRLNEELEQRVSERTEELAREHEFSQTLLRISTELSSSLDLDMVLNRSLLLLNDVTGAEHSTIVVMRPPEEYLIYRAGAGIHEAPPTGGRTSTLEVGEGLAGWVIENRQAVVIPDLLEDERWKKDHGITTVYRSAIAVPLIVGADALGCLLLYHRKGHHFREGQIDAIRAAANQFAVTITNGDLFRMIRDQAESLGNMLRAQQIEASRSMAMLEGVADGVLVTDNSNIITLFNDAAEEILELQRDQLLGKSLDNFIGLFGGAAQSWMGAIRKWSSGPTEELEGEAYSERLTLEDGRVISVHLAPVSNRQEFLGTVSIFRDITHQVEVDRLKSEFVATVSHELRTPMTPIKGYVEFLLMGGAGELNEQQGQFLDIIKANVDRLSILVNDLLDVSRIEAGKVALSFQPIDMNEIAQEVIENLIRASEEDQRPVNFDLHSPEDIPSVYGDIERVRQIMTNLMDNAYKYSPENSTVTITMTPKEEALQIDIKDQGIGIFPDEHERIFERFYRGENHLVMATPGTGLGLPIVKELVEMHNGRIWLTSSGVPGEGSTFSFTLPIYQFQKKTEKQPEEA